MTVDEQLLPVTERWQDVALEAAPSGAVEGHGVDDKEASVDQVIREHRLLLELHHAVVGSDLERPVLGWERYDGDRCGAAMSTVVGDQCLEIDIADAVAVREEEGLAHPVEARDDAVAGVSVVTGVDDIDRPFARELRDVFGDHVTAVAGGQDELRHALTRVDVHDVVQQRPVTDLDHRFRHVRGRWPRPNAAAAAEDQCAHAATLGLPTESSGDLGTRTAV